MAFETVVTDLGMGGRQRERERERKPAVYEIGSGSRPEEKCGTCNHEILVTFNVSVLQIATGERILEFKIFNTALVGNNTNNLTFFHLTN